MTTTRRVGDKVSVDDPKYPGIWKITKVNPTTYTLEPEHGGRGLRAHHGMVTDPTTAAAAVKPVTYYHPGELVEIGTGKFAGLWVVISDRAGDKVSLAKLGGDGGKYLRAARRGLVKVDPESVLRNEDPDKEWLS